MSAFFDDMNYRGRTAVNDFLVYIGYPYPDDLVREDNPLWLFGIAPFSAETCQFVVDLFLQLVKGSDWSPEEKSLWIDRYVLNKPAKYVARRLKRTPAWVHGRLYRCKQKLAKMTKGWWEEQLSGEAQCHLPELMERYIEKTCKNMKVY